MAARDQVLHAPQPPNLAPVQDGDAVADHLHVGHLVRRKKEGAPLVLEVQDQIADVSVGHRVQARRRLIKKQHFGVINQCLRDADALKHALGEGAQRLLARPLQADQFEQRVHALVLGGPGQPEERAVEADDFTGGHMLIEVGAFGQVGDLLLDVNIAGGLAEDTDGAGAGEDQAKQGLDGGRLPGAVGAEEAEDLALIDIQADVVDGDDAAVLLDEMVDLNRLRVARVGIGGGRRRLRSRAGRR